MQILSKFPEPAEIHKSVNGRCILDGKIVVLAGGILDEGAVWVNPDYVCVIEYMPNSLNSLRQPVFKGFRDDVPPGEVRVE